MAELRTLKQKGDKFQILAISIDPATRSKELRAKIAKDGKGEVNFPLLSDPGGKTINAYGLYDPAYANQQVDGIPKASVVILDKNRKVVWTRIESNYRYRPPNEEIKVELGKLK